jgi:sporulation protein YunB
MRAKYYKLSLRQMKKEKSFVFFLILLVIFSSITTLYKQVIEPILIQFTESNAYTLSMKVTEKAIRENLENITYDNIISNVKDENGKIVALQANTNELNRISNNLAISIEENISNIDESDIKIPLALLFNTGIFGGVGVKVKIKTVPLGDTKIECKSEFDSVGINQTRHRIILDIKTYYTIIAPVYIKNECYEKEVVLAETIINGDIPNTYYNLDLTKESELLNLTD